MRALKDIESRSRNLPRTTAPTVLEADIERLILQFLEHTPGCYAWKNHTSGYFDTKKQKFVKQRSKYAINGVSDILGIFRGKFIAIEVKRPENKDRPQEQIDFINQINKNDGIGFFATSLEEVKEKLGLR